MSAKPRRKATAKPPAPAPALITRDGDRRNGLATITPRGRALMERMFAEGQDFRTVAKALGISGETLQQCRKRDPAVDAAWEAGQAALSDELTHLLLKQARKGNVVAAIFLAKARCGWREGDAPEARPNIVINLPDAATPEQYMRMVNAPPSRPGEPPALPGPDTGGPTR